MACIITACKGTTYVEMAGLDGACVVVVHTDMAYTVMVYIGKACIGTAFVYTAYVDMAYVDMAFVVMADVLRTYIGGYQHSYGPGQVGASPRAIAVGGKKRSSLLY